MRLANGAKIKPTDSKTGMKRVHLAAATIGRATELAGARTLVD
jgi:hypothetical protein